MFAFRSPLIEADFVKVYFNSTSNTFQTEDAFLAKKIMCDFNVGLCSDTKHNSFDQVKNGLSIEVLLSNHKSAWYVLKYKQIQKWPKWILRKTNRIRHLKISNRWKKLTCVLGSNVCVANEKGQIPKMIIFSQVTFMGSMQNHGLSVVDFRRSILPKDKHDAPITLDGPTQVLD